MIVDVTDQNPDDFYEVDGEWSYFESLNDYKEFIRIKKLNKIISIINGK